MAQTDRITAFALLACGMLTGCAESGPPSADSDCLVPGQHHVAMVDMYFGRDVAGGAPVSDKQWTDFVSTEVAPRFPDGFTVFDANGQWFDPNARHVVREGSKVLRVVAPEGGDLAGRVQALSGAYKLQFHQQSVLMVSSDLCAGF